MANPTEASTDMMQAAPAQSDYDKLRRLPFFYAFSVLTATAVMCTVQAPLALFAAELGLDKNQIGLLGGVVPFFQVLGIATLPLISFFGSRRMAAFSLFMRYGFLGLFFLAPFYLTSPDTVFYILLTAMIGFSFMRTMAEAALVPWSQDFMPRAIRGQISGRTALAYVPVALVISWLIQLWLDGQQGLERFYPVFFVGIVIGSVGALSLLGLRGGEPTARPSTQKRLGGTAIMRSLRDRNFVIFLYSSATQYLVFLAINLFMLLFFRERLGMSSGQLVLMAAFIPVGAAAGTIVAGWFVDRYGARSIRVAFQIGQVLLLLAVPFISTDMVGVHVAVGLVFLLFGVLFQASIAVGNVYMLNIIPPSAKEAYTSVHYTVDGIVGGGVTFLAGSLLAWLQADPPTMVGLQLDSYNVLFVLAALITASSAYAFTLLKEEGAISVRAFVGHFSTGSTMRALWSIYVYGSQTSEDRRRDLAYGFGSSGSPLAKQELIEALRDPSFDVRHEAIHALGHMAAHDDVVTALTAVLDYEGLVELQYAALASLGRLRANSVADKVASFLVSSTPLLRARAIRTLGEMRHEPSLISIRSLLDDDPDLDCRLAAVSALGKYKDSASMSSLLVIYKEQATDAGAMSEPRSKVVLLAMAKILNLEESFSQQWRREEKNPGHALPELMMRLAGALKNKTDGAKDAKQIASIAPALDMSKLQPAFAAVCASRPAVTESQHADSMLIAEMIDTLADIENPHPALLVLLTLATRRALRR